MIGVSRKRLITALVSNPHALLPPPAGPATAAARPAATAHPPASAATLEKVARALDSAVHARAVITRERAPLVDVTDALLLPHGGGGAGSGRDRGSVAASVSDDAAYEAATRLDNDDQLRCAMRGTSGVRSRHTLPHSEKHRLLCWSFLCFVCVHNSQLSRGPSLLLLRLFSLLLPPFQTCNVH